MMGLGMMELLLLLVLSPAAPFGKPADAATVFRHVPDESVLVVTADVASLAQGAQKEFERLLKMPVFNKSVLMQQAAQAMRSGRAMFEARAKRFGVDPFRDIRYATLALGIGEQGEKFLAVLGGKLPQKAFDTVVADAGATREDGVFVLPGGEQVLARAADGAVLFGSRDWVGTALAGEQRHPSWKRLLSGHDRSTYFMFAFRPGAHILAEWKREMDVVFHPLLIDGFQGMSLRLTYRGSELRVEAPDARRAGVWGGVLRGFGLVSVAGRDAAEGLLQMGESFLASLDPLPALDAAGPEEKEMLRVLVGHRTEIRKMLVRQLLGKRQKARVRVDKRRKSAILTMSGKGLASVLVLPMSAGMFLMRGSAEEEPATAVPPAAADPAPAPVPHGP